MPSGNDAAKKCLDCHEPVCPGDGPCGICVSCDALVHAGCFGIARCKICRGQFCADCMEEEPGTCEGCTPECVQCEAFETRICELQDEVDQLKAMILALKREAKRKRNKRRLRDSTSQVPPAQGLAPSSKKQCKTAFSHPAMARPASAVSVSQHVTTETHTHTKGNCGGQ